MSCLRRPRQLDDVLRRVLHDPLDRGGQSLGGLVSGISEIVTALGGRNEFEELTGSLPQRLFRASGTLNAAAL